MTDKSRVTIMIDSTTHKKIHDLQADLIRSTNRSISYSRVIEALALIGLKKKGEIDLG